MSLRFISAMVGKRAQTRSKISFRLRNLAFSSFSLSRSAFDGDFLRIAGPSWSVISGLWFSSDLSVNSSLISLNFDSVFSDFWECSYWACTKISLDSVLGSSISCLKLRSCDRVISVSLTFSGFWKFIFFGDSH